MHRTFRSDYKYEKLETDEPIEVKNNQPFPFGITNRRQKNLKQLDLNNEKYLMKIERKLPPQYPKEKQIITVNYYFLSSGIKYFQLDYGVHRFFL